MRVGARGVSGARRWFLVGGVGGIRGIGERGGGGTSWVVCSAVGVSMRREERRWRVGY